MIKIKPNQQSLDAVLKSLNTKVLNAIEIIQNEIEEIEFDDSNENEKYIRKTELKILLQEMYKFRKVIENSQEELKSNSNKK